MPAPQDDHPWQSCSSQLSMDRRHQRDSANSANRLSVPRTCVGFLDIVQLPRARPVCDLPQESGQRGNWLWRICLWPENLRRGLRLAVSHQKIGIAYSSWAGEFFSGKTRPIGRAKVRLEAPCILRKPRQTTALSLGPRRPCQFQVCSRAEGP